MCLVLGRIFGTCVIVLLSSNTVHFTSAAVLGWTSQPLLFISLSVPINGMAARRDMDIPISSDSVEDSDISDCNWDVHITGNPACLMMHPCRDRAVSMPLLQSLDLSCLQMMRQRTLPTPWLDRVSWRALCLQWLSNVHQSISQLSHALPWG